MTGMFIRPCYRRKNGKRHAYWALMESHRTERGPRQRVVAYLGQLDEQGRLGVQAAAEGRKNRQQKLFDDVRPQWVEVDAAAVRVENCRDFGGPWLGLELVRRLGLNGFLEQTLPRGREDIRWSAMALVLVLCRLCNPSSELHIAEHFYAQSALADLVGVPPEKINEQRLYRALDAVLPHKEALEIFLKGRLGELFDLAYDLLFYDVTSTYFEGQAEGNPLAKRGYSRDHRPDCKQVCIGLVVSKCGLPLGYEVFAGNRHDFDDVSRNRGRDGTPLRPRRSHLGGRSRHGLRGKHYFHEVGAAAVHRGHAEKSMLKKFERELLAEDWHVIRDGLEVKLCPAPDGEETFVLCRSRDRSEKEKAMHARFERHIEEGLQKIEAGCRRQRLQAVTVAPARGDCWARTAARRACSRSK